MYYYFVNIKFLKDDTLRICEDGNTHYYFTYKSNKVYSYIIKSITQKYHNGDIIIIENEYGKQIAEIGKCNYIQNCSANGAVVVFDDTIYYIDNDLIERLDSSKVRILKQLKEPKIVGNMDVNKCNQYCYSPSISLPHHFDDMSAFTTWHDEVPISNKIIEDFFKNMRQEKNKKLFEKEYKNCSINCNEIYYGYSANITPINAREIKIGDIIIYYNDVIKISCLNYKADIIEGNSIFDNQKYIIAMYGVFGERKLTKITKGQ